MSAGDREAEAAPVPPDDLYSEIERRLEHNAWCTNLPGHDCTCDRPKTLARLRLALAAPAEGRERRHCPFHASVSLATCECSVAKQMRSLVAFAPRPGGEATGWMARSLEEAKANIATWPQWKRELSASLDEVRTRLAARPTTEATGARGR